MNPKPHIHPPIQRPGSACVVFWPEASLFMCHLQEDSWPGWGPDIFVANRGVRSTYVVSYGPSSYKAGEFINNVNGHILSTIVIL